MSTAQTGKQHMKNVQHYNSTIPYTNETKRIDIYCSKDFFPLSQPNPHSWASVSS